MEGDRTVFLHICAFTLFQSTPSAWRETDTSQEECLERLHFNPLPPHGGRRRSCESGHLPEIISIHSLRMEGDGFRNPVFHRHTISIHSLRMEGDFHRRRNHIDQHDFNPLPPHGGRLMENLHLRCTKVFQSTPSAWRETLLVHINGVLFVISIHSLRMEGDTGFRSV